MNRYFKKKASEPLTANEHALRAFSAPPPPPPPPPPPTSDATSQLKKSASRWRKSTKKPIEDRPQVNLDLALPSNDDFRTSLFMPALTARFSMLREQDDPNSMLGKASDDSVLQPRRRSRMDFGVATRGLDDIAEVASIRSSTRPPFSELHHHSFASEDDYNSENDSSYCGSAISRRARPGEGNTMFGGRQRVYIVPKNGASSRSIGRAVYEDDLGTSLFQRYRRQRDHKDPPEARESDDSHGFDFGLDQSEAGDQDDRDAPLPSDSAKDLSHSPSLSSSDKKHSLDSNSRSVARSSTAATSVTSQPTTCTTSPVKSPSQPPSAAATPSPASAPAPIPAMQPLKRSDTKARRLYEQGLDQHMLEQQSSALNRLNSIHRQRGLSNKQPQMYLHSTKSAGNLHDKAQQPVYALPAQESPSMTPIFGLFGPAGLSNSNGTSPMPSLPATPMSPQHGMDFDDFNALSQALEPADRGKATAMGAFNKPKQSFDEQQYLERQRQLQRSASTAALKKDIAHQSIRQRLDEIPTPDVVASRVLPRPAMRQGEPAKVHETFQASASEGDADVGAVEADRSDLPDSHRTFFGDISASESEDEDDQADVATKSPISDYGYGTQHGKWQPVVLPSVSEHPALRSKKSKVSLADDDQESISQPQQNPLSARPPRIETEIDNAESPGFGPDTPTVALNGLMHHLRQKSNVSSITQRSDATSANEPAAGESSAPAELTPRNLDIVNRRAHSTAYSESRVGSYAISNPWDLDDIDNSSQRDVRLSRPPVSPIGSEHLGGRFDDASSTMNRHSVVSELDPEPEAEVETKTEVQANGNEAGETDPQAQHTRDASTATQQDRDAFDNELAARRNAIQENIRKSKAEREHRSRGASPSRTSSTAFRTFSMLRSKPSRESVDSSRAPDLPASLPPKALQILGSSASAVALHSQYQAGAIPSDSNRPRDRSGSRPSPPNTQPRISQRSDRDLRRLTQGTRTRENSEVEPFPPVNASPPASIHGRSRANSAATTSRSRSRTGPYRDDLEKAMIEGTGSSTASIPDLGAMGPRELTPHPTPDFNQSAFESARARSGSRAAMTTYFDAKSLQPIHTGSRERLNAGVPSPALTAGHYSPMPSPLPRSPASAYASNMTPPLSGASTPLQPTFSAPAQIPPSSGRPGGVLRKKTISKGDISEPTFISSTSSVELVNLPEGASLKNGMEEAPPLPPLNPARRATKRILSFGRKESQDGSASSGNRSKTPEFYSRKSPEPDFPFDMSRKISPQRVGVKQGSDPASSSNGYAPMTGSPERVERSPPAARARMDGAMF